MEPLILLAFPLLIWTGLYFSYKKMGLTKRKPALTKAEKPALPAPTEPETTQPVDAKKMLREFEHDSWTADYKSALRRADELG